ncbi:MAG TPA: menaquinone biosynthesis decarboxylase, partial [Nitrososphaera sp.]|nr:menaquinone biosynthesis decarboxylase [Nitrososphaera sp.]
MFIVVDSDINVHDINEVIWALTTQADPARDTVIINNAPTDTLDPASPLVNLGSKLGIDATAKWRDEGYMREIQQLAVVDEKTKALVDNKWDKYFNGTL